MTLQATKEDKTSVDVKADGEGRLEITSSVATPLFVRAAEALPVTTTTDDGIAQTQDVTNSHAVGLTAVEIALPEENGVYMLQARGCDVHILTGSGSVSAATASAGGYSLLVMDGQTLTVQLAGDKLSHIGTEGGFFVCCHMDRS